MSFQYIQALFGFFPNPRIKHKTYYIILYGLHMNFIFYKIINFLHLYQST